MSRNASRFFSLPGFSSEGSIFVNTSGVRDDFFAAAAI